MQRDARAAALVPSPGFPGELLFRALAVAGLGMFAFQAFGSYRATGALPVLLLLVAESITVALVVCARRARLRSLDAESVLLTACATYYFVFIALEPGAAVAPRFVGEALQVLGIGWQIAAKLALGRSFGLLPANRGVVARGPYRVVRHPIYLGYFIAHMGFLLYAFTPLNMVLFASLYAMQVARMLREEQLLAADADYRRYRAEVRWRFVPGVF